MRIHRNQLVFFGILSLLISCSESTNPSEEEHVSSGLLSSSDGVSQVNSSSSSISVGLSEPVEYSSVQEVEKSSSSSLSTSSSSNEVSSSSYEPVACGALAANEFCDDRDGQIYKMTVIGGHTWMAENLNYDNQNTDLSRCYDNDPQQCEIHGRLYTWDAAMISCPTGWKLASRAHYDALVVTIGGREKISEALKSQTIWAPEYAGMDTYGFAMLPSGQYSPDGFEYLGRESLFWTSTMESNSSAYERHTYRTTYTWTDENMGFYNYLSVRCVKK